MTTTDSNGIVFLQDTDNISPFHTLINGLQTATSTAVEKAGRGPFYAADNTARDALLTQHGASSTNPLWVDVAGTLERNAGSGWVTIASPNPPRIKAGYFSGSTSAGGTVSVNHGLGVIPTAVLVTIGTGPAGVDILLTARSYQGWWTSTTFDVQITRHDTNGTLNSNPVAFSWLAIA